MDKVAQVAANALVDNNIIPIELRNYYEYAIVTLIEKIVSVMTLLVIGVCFERTIPAILFILFFIMLRKRTGGYHAKTFTLCYIESILLFVLLMVFGDLLIVYPSAMIIAVGSSFVLIMYIGTINHSGMNYSTDELEEAKKSARYVLLLEMMILMAANDLGVSRHYVGFMAWAIIMCAISMVMAKITDQEVHYDGK